MAEAMKKTWRKVGIDYAHPRVISMLFLGFSAGVPILLIFSSLGLWLREAGVDRSTVTMFSWAALGYAFKFVWAPLIDRLPVPFLTKLLGRRRAWILVSQLSIMFAILWMASIDPAGKGEFTLVMMAMATVLLGFSSATQDIVIDAYRIEAADKDSQTLISSIYVAGYRIGMLVAGAGALFLASHWGSDKDHYEYTAWLWSYQSMAIVMLLGVATTLIIPKPRKFCSMKVLPSTSYLLVLTILLFSANEIAFLLSESENFYYLVFVWLIRLLFLGSTLYLLSKTKLTTLDTSTLVILSMSLLTWVGQFKFQFYFSFPYLFFWIFIVLCVGIYISIYIRKHVNALTQEKKTSEDIYTTSDYLGFLFLFVFSILGFIAVYVLSSDLVSKFKSVEWYSSSVFFHSLIDNLMVVPDTIASIKESLSETFNNNKLSSLLVGTARLITAIVVAVMIGWGLTNTRAVNTEMVYGTYVAPIKDFFLRYGVSLSLLLLALIGLYRISDIVLGVTANLFYQDIGYSKEQIAGIVKTFGLFMTIAGGFLGGILALRVGVMKALFLGALLTVATNLLFVLLAQIGQADEKMLYIVISADNLTGGLAVAAFVAFLSSLTNIKFTAVQYAVFSSLMLLIPKAIGGYSGSIVDSYCKGQGSCMLGYENFFIFASLIGIPVLLLVWLANKYLNIGEFSLKN